MRPSFLLLADSVRKTDRSCAARAEGPRVEVEYEQETEPLSVA